MSIGRSELSKAYDDYNDFKIEEIKWDTLTNQSVPDFSEIEPQYVAPSISVDSSGRFSEHDIIGGSVVRQKIGESALEVNISGVCKVSTAKKIDDLRIARYGTIFSDRLPGSSIKVQFASASTSPLEDGGAYEFSGEDREFLHTYDISCVEVTEI